MGRNATLKAKQIAYSVVDSCIGLEFHRNGKIYTPWPREDAPFPAPTKTRC